MELRLCWSVSIVFTALRLETLFVNCDTLNADSRHQLALHKHSHTIAIHNDQLYFGVCVCFGSILSTMSRHQTSIIHFECLAFFPEWIPLSTFQYKIFNSVAFDQHESAHLNLSRSEKNFFPILSLVVLSKHVYSRALSLQM